MTDTIKAFGKEWNATEHATVFVTVPEGEVEAHVFVSHGLLGNRSDFEGKTLDDMIAASEDAAVARTLREAGLTLADVVELLANKPDQRLSHLDKAPIDHAILNSDLIRYHKRLAERNQEFSDGLAALEVEIAALKTRTTTDIAQATSGRFDALEKRIDRFFEERGLG